MAQFTIISPRGNRLPLLGSDIFQLINIDGQTSLNNSLSSASLAGADGDYVNHVVTDPRTIKIELYMTGNVETAKRYILGYIKPKQTHALEWQQEKRTLVISGICESIDMARWQNGIVLQISFHCSQPYWEDAEAVIQEVSETIRLHYFTAYANDMLYFPAESVGAGIVMGEYDVARTKTFYNSGDVSIGLTIVVNALKSVTNPIIYASPTAFIGANVTLAAGDTLTITTQRGNKDIKKGNTSVISKIMPGSTWLQLETGDNTFTIDADDADINNMYFQIIYNQRYV